MGISKVVYGGNTLMDLTADTVTPETLIEGITAHNASGELITGILANASGSTYEAAYGSVTVTSLTTPFTVDTGLSDAPDYFILWTRWLGDTSNGWSSTSGACCLSVLNSTIKDTYTLIQSWAGLSTQRGGFDWSDGGKVKLSTASTSNGWVGTYDWVALRARE